jgi:hypothetical protein
MTTEASAPMERWNTLPWTRIQRNVFKLQKRMYVRHESRVPAYENATTEENSSRESLFPVPA